MSTSVLVSVPAADTLPGTTAPSSKLPASITAPSLPLVTVVTTSGLPAAITILPFPDLSLSGVSPSKSICNDKEPSDKAVPF